MDSKLKNKRKDNLFSQISKHNSGEFKMYKTFKNIITIFCLLLLLNHNQLLSSDDKKGKNIQQEQVVHRYIIREAYKRLVYHLGYDIPELKRHLGDDQSGTGPFNPGGLVVIGAHREDEEDIVYGYNSVVIIPGLLSIPTATCSHFWRPDHGDDTPTSFNGPASILGNYPNAYQKVRAFIDGHYNFSFESASHSYAGLFNYYKNRGIKRNGAQVTHTPAQRDKIVWEIIGRVCHLLADMSMPAHVKNDIHAPIPNQTYADTYETVMESRYNQYTATTARNYGSLVPTYITDSSYVDSVKTLKNLFYTSAQIADHFNSDDLPGNDSWDRNEEFSVYYTGSNGITLQTKINSLPPVSYTPNSNGFYLVNYDSVARHCFNYTINATASLLLWCAHEMGIVPFVVPNQYSTIASAVQAATSSGRTVKDVLVLSGTHTLTNSLVIPSGVNVIIYPSVTVNFNGGLTIQGTLEVKNGATLNFGNNMNLTIAGSLSTDGATFNFTNGGIVVNGTLSAKDATIKCSSLTVNGNMEVNGLTMNCSGPATIGGYFRINGLYSYLTFSSGLTVTGDIISDGALGSLSSTTRFMIGGNGLVISSGGYAQFIYTNFYGPGTSSNWVGIAINGGFGSFGYCKIFNSYGTYGISINSSTLAIDHTQIASKDYGLNFTNSSGFIYTNNCFENSNCNIQGDGGSGIFAGDVERNGENSFRGTGSYHIYSTRNGTISARGNYWAGGIPKITSNVDASNRLPSDINLNMQHQGDNSDDNKTEVGQELFLRKTTVENDKPIEKVPGIEELDKATLLLCAEKYDEALIELYKLVDKYQDGFVGNRALVLIEVILARTKRDKEILPMLEQYSNGKSKVAQFANYRKGYQYFRLKEYDKGIAIMKTTELNKEDVDLMQARLFDLGVVYHDVFGKKAEAYNYFNELLKTYPDCPLAEVVNTFYKITKDGYNKPNAKEETTVTETKLFANYPNPFNPSTVIKYQLSEASLVSLKVYDVMGKEVTTLVNSFQNKGNYDVTFNAKNLSSGIYFYKLNANGKQHINKMLLMK